MVHEYGHLSSARRNNIEVEEFSIGFGKTLKTWTTERGLLMKLKLIPFGGAVKPLAMTPEDVREQDLDKAGTFAYAHPLRKLRVSVAGSGFNIVLAFLTAIVVSIWISQPTTLDEWVTMPSVAFWTSLIILGALINTIFIAPFTGFADIHSIVGMPEGMQSTVEASHAQDIPIITVIMIIFMMINLFMALFNLIPIAPLDGFTATVAIIDTGRMYAQRDSANEYTPIETRSLKWLLIAGNSLLISVMGFIILRDVIGIFS